MSTRPLGWYLLKMIRYAPIICAIHAILWGLINSSTLLYGVLISRLISDIESGVDDRAKMIALAFAGLGIGQSVLWLLAGHTEIAMRFRMSGVVRRNLLRMLLATPGTVALSHSVGDTISRFRDDAYLAEDALDWTDEMAMQVLIACGALGVMLWIDPILTIITVVPTMAIILGARLAGRHLAALRRASSDATSQFTSTVGDVVASALMIQAAGASDRAVNHIADLALNRRSTTLKDRVVTQSVEGITRNASAIGTGLVMLFASTRIRDGELSVANFVLFSSWFATVIGITVECGNYLAQMAAARVAFDRMEAVSQLAPDSMSIVDHTPLHLSGPLPVLAEKTMAGNRHPLDDLQFTVSAQSIALERGRLTVITGRIGSGKTRLLQSLLGLDPSSDARFLLNGMPFDDMRGISSELTIGYVPQVPRLFSGTIRENILLGRTVHPNDLANATNLAALEHDIANFPDGLNTVVGARGLRVSGGQAQRIALARALVIRPALLVVDDLSSALDVNTERAVWRELKSVQDLTILAVSHRRFLLQQADQIIVLRSGCIDAIGSLENVLMDSHEMRVLWEHPEEVSEEE